ncbi:MAG: helix-turn-helix transcriptional regulator [Gammaproteobacteria bacterium]
MTRPALKSFKKSALKQAGVKKAYDDLAPAYEIRKKLISLRHEAGLTQAQVAQKLHTNKSNISRLESVDSDISPKLSTLADYAAAIGYKLKIDFIPDRQPRR